jgi:phage-related protein
MAGPSVLVRIMGDASGFSKAVDTTQSAASKVASAVGGTITSAARLAATALTVAGGAAVAFGVSSFQTAARVGEMNATLKALSKGNNEVYKSMTDSVATIRKQGVEAGVAQNLVAQFSRNNLDLASATKLATVAQDAAVISGQNSSEVLDQLTHGIITQNSQVLRNAGVNVQAGQAIDKYAASMGKSARDLTDAERSQAVLNAVIQAGIPIQGAYAAAMEEPGKVLRSFPRLFDDIKVTVGEGLVNAFGPLILQLYEMTKSFSNSIKEGGNLRPILDAINQVVLKMVAPLGELVKKGADFLKAIPAGTVEKIAGSIGKMGGAVAGLGGAIGVMGLKNIPVLGQLLGSINPIVAGLAIFVGSTKEGQSAIKALIDAVVPLAQLLITSLMPAFKQVINALLPLVPLIANIVRDLIGALMPTVTALIAAVMPLIPVLVQVVGILGDAFSQVIYALAPILEQLAKAIGEILAAVVPLLPPLAQLVSQIVDLLVQAIAPLLPPIIELIKSAIIPLLPAISALIKPISQLVAALTPLITLVANLVGIILKLISLALVPLITVLANVVSWLVGGVVNAFAGMLNAITSVFRWVQSNWPLLLAILTGPIGLAVLAIVRNFDAIKAGIDKVFGWFKDLGEKILGAITDIAGKMYDAGRNILESLGKGISDAAGAVIDKAKGVADKVKGLWPFSPAEWGPFRDNPPQKAGEAIIRQIADGMVRQQGYLERTAATVAQSAAIDPSYLAPTGTAGAQPQAAARGPALVITNATFTDNADVESLMRQTEFAVSAGRL